MSKQGRGVESWGELPGVRTPTQKPGAFTQALCLSHSAKSLLLSAWVICDFRMVLSFTARNASDFYLISEVMQSGENMLLPLAAEVFVDYTGMQDGSLCPWALHHLKIHTWMLTVRSHPLCWGRGSHHNLVWVLWFEPFSYLLIFCILFWFMGFFSFGFQKKKKKAMKNLLKQLIHVFKKEEEEKKKSHQKLSNSAMARNGCRDRYLQALYLQ